MPSPKWSKLRIRNFGPIKEGYGEDDGWFEINKVTIFIGDTGTGKSAIAKLIATFLWLEKALNRGDFTAKYVEQYNRFVKIYCGYHNIQPYFRPQTSIEFRGTRFSFIYQDEKLEVSDSDETLLAPQQMFVPAERNFLSLVERADKIKGLPKALFEFLREYQDALDAMDGPLPLPVGVGASLHYDSMRKIARLKGDGFDIKLTQAASGYQSAAPLFLVSKYLANQIGKATEAGISELSLEQERKLLAALKANSKLKRPRKEDVVRDEILAQFRNHRFVNIVEEMEQNLFPASQRRLLNELLRLVNIRAADQLILTTHSPYVINGLNLAIQGAEVYEELAKSAAVLSADRAEKLRQIIPKESVIEAGLVTIYELSPEGTIMRLPTTYGIPSDDNLLNEALGKENEDFLALLDFLPQA